MKMRDLSSWTPKSSEIEGEPNKDNPTEKKVTKIAPEKHKCPCPPSPPQPKIVGRIWA